MPGVASGSAARSPGVGAEPEQVPRAVWLWEGALIFPALALIRGTATCGTTMDPAALRSGPSFVLVGSAEDTRIVHARSMDLTVDGSCR